MPALGSQMKVVTLSLNMTIILYILSDCGRHLKDEELRLFVPSCRLLRAVQVGSSHACELVLARVLPTLVDVYNCQSLVRDFIRARKEKPSWKLHLVSKYDFHNTTLLYLGLFILFVSFMLYVTVDIFF